jgi:hypothetical protein
VFFLIFIFHINILKWFKIIKKINLKQKQFKDFWKTWFRSAQEISVTLLHWVLYFPNIYCFKKCFLCLGEALKDPAWGFLIRKEGKKNTRHVTVKFEELSVQSPRLLYWNNDFNILGTHYSPRKIKCGLIKQFGVFQTPSDGVADGWPIEKKRGKA